jgi:hypothetical protein
MSLQWLIVTEEWRREIMKTGYPEEEVMKEKN